MKKILLPAMSIATGVIGASSYCTNSAPPKQKLPNIIYILADDLGYGDLGCYGQQKIETPNIDMLAREGMRFTQHYSGAPVSAPARCALLTGMHTGNAQIRGNDEWSERGDVWSYRSVLADSTLEGQYPMADNTLTIASILKQAGYSTSIFGKWGLGAPHSNSVPTKMGFDYFMGYNCQRQSHTYYPVHLYRNNKKVLLHNDTVAPHTRLKPIDNPYDSISYKPFNLNSYACDVMFDDMTSYLNKVDPNKTGHPFFIYWATPIPHLPLQVPKRWVDHYVNKFGQEEPYIGNTGYFPNQYPRATYAAMISYLDEQVGLLVAQLKSMGLYENTLIIFTSDNGPAFNGGADPHWFNSNFPFKNDYGYSKGFLHEGGIRVPMIATWPAKIKPGTVSHHVSAFWDVLPTLSEIADSKTEYKSDGISFLNELSGKRQSNHPHLYWELHEYNGQQAVRLGNWKGIRKNIFKGNRHVELYNLENDIQEQTDLSSEHPEIVKEMERIMELSHKPTRIKKFNF